MDITMSSSESTTALSSKDKTTQLASSHPTQSSVQSPAGSSQEQGRFVRDEVFFVHKLNVDISMIPKLCLYAFTRTWYVNNG
jgi:hypothetical protein